MKKERKLIIAGNWKMNKTVAEALDLVRDLKTELATIEEVDIVVFPPFTALSEVAKVVHGSNIHLGAQNMRIAARMVSGTSPIYAGIYQFIIVAMILAASGIAGLISTLLNPNAFLLTGSTIDASRGGSAQADPCSGQSAIVRWVSMG
jgi:hypothetical protein